MSYKFELRVGCNLDGVFNNLPDDELSIVTEMYNRVQQFLEDYSLDIFDDRSFEYILSTTGIIKDNKVYIYIDKPNQGIENPLFDYTIEDDFSSKQLKALIDYAKYLLFAELAYLILPDSSESKYIGINVE